MTLTKTNGRRWTPLSVATTVLAFVIWWPLGLALIAYILWGGNVDGHLKDTWAQVSKRSSPTFRYTPAHPTSGNRVFDDYKQATLRRLEEEQQAFAAYVERLRAARDQEEFDRFMADRRLERNETSGN